VGFLIILYLAQFGKFANLGATVKVVHQAVS